MPETPTAAELVITARTLDAFQRAVRFERDYADDLREIVAPVVAAELRRIADAQSAAYETPRDAIQSAWWDGVDNVTDQLRARADELDPPAKET